MTASKALISLLRPSSQKSFLSKRFLNNQNLRADYESCPDLSIQSLPPPFAQKSATRWDAIRQARPLASFLRDSFDRGHDYLRISITERCNLRCTYCMPSEGIQLSPLDHLLTTSEIVHLAALFVNAGVTKIRLTGGEPTIRPDLLPLMEQLGALKANGLRDLALTTNGITLHRNLDRMIDAGLTAVNVSLDSLEHSQYQILTRRNGLDAVYRSIATIIACKKAGTKIKLKINCVVMRGINDNELGSFVEMSRHEDLEIRFIEYMPFGQNEWSRRKMVSYAEMLAKVQDVYPTLTKLPAKPNETSVTWGVPGFVGRIGFITSMTDHFCGTCNRLRITTDGNLKVCLHDEAEVSLRDILRNPKRDRSARDDVDGDLETAHDDSELIATIDRAVKGKKERHAEAEDLSRMNNRPMILIGG